MPKKKLYSSGGIIYSTDPGFDVEGTSEEHRTLPAHEQLLTVITDTKHRGGKMVTLVKGFSGTAADLQQLAKQLKSYCGTGGSVKNNEVIIQGDNSEKVLQWLNKMGYKAAKGR
jgi:translation initiation factor 1